MSPTGEPHSASSLARAAHQISNWTVLSAASTLNAASWILRFAGSVGRSPFSRLRVPEAISRTLRPRAQRIQAASVWRSATRARS